MKLTTAIKVLQQDAKFLGMNFTDFIKFVQAGPLAQPKRTLQAYQVYISS
jgi:hypothetical protein